MKKIKVPSKEELKNLYINLKYTIKELSIYYKCSSRPIKKWLKGYNITKSDQERIQAAKDSYMRKHGVATPFENKEVQSKVQTILKETIYNNPERMREVQNKREDTLEIRCGVRNSGQLESTKAKVKITTKKLYGKEHYSQTEEYRRRVKATNLIKRGVSYPMQSKDVLNKSRKTCLAKYDVDNYAKSQESKERYNDNKYIERITSKQYATRKMHSSFKTSKEEDNIFTLLVDKFGIKDVARQFRSSRYPFACDFYIHSIDMYIEYQGMWTHGKKPYNSNDEECIRLIEKWKRKANELNFKNNKKKFYLNAINVYLTTDPLKRETAKKNKLNWNEFFTMEQFMEWYNKQ